MSSGVELSEADHLETLISMAEGKTVAETAAEWGVSERCVSTRRRATLAWLGATNPAHAIYLACRRGILH